MILRLLCSIVAISICGATLLTAQIQSKLSASSVHAVMTVNAAAQRSQGECAQAIRSVGHPFSMENGKPMVRAFFELAHQADTMVLLQHGGRIRSTIGTIVSVTLPVASLDAVCRDARVTKAQLSTMLRTSLNESVKEIRADKVHLGEGLPKPYTGKNVIIGVFDTGIDVDHPDFRTSGGSRILNLWDMSDNAGTPPSGFTWGREYSASDLNTGGTSVAERDNGGHGTHVAGIAAGGGRSNIAYQGVAPEADLIIVKGVRSPQSESFADDDIVAGCQYIFQRASALGKQAVINLSLGSAIGPHDGSELYVKALDALVEPGHLIVVAAGNEGGQPIHAGGSISATTNLEALINPFNVCSIFEGLCPSDPNYFMTAADIWYTKGCIDTLLVAVYGGTSGLEIATIVPVPIGTDLTEQAVKVGEKTVGYLTVISSTKDLPNGSGNIFLQITNKGNASVPVDSSLWGLGFRGAGDGRVDLWAGIPIPEQFPILGQLGTTIYGNTEMTIGTPATGKNMISVGSYITKNEWTSLVGPQSEAGTNIGAVSGFSSKGPTRDGRMVPTVGAPGEVIFSALTSAWKPGDAKYDSTHIVPDGQYLGMSGTSMAAPHVTGVVALMMEAKPPVTLERVRAILDRTSRHDGANPEDNNEMGYGKIDALDACLFLTSSVSEIDEHASLLLHPNPARDMVTLQLPYTVQRVEVVSAVGTVMFTSTLVRDAGQTWTMSTSSLPAGLYYVRMQSDRSVNTVPVTVIH